MELDTPSYSNQEKTTEDVRQEDEIDMEVQELEELQKIVYALSESSDEKGSGGHPSRSCMRGSSRDMKSSGLGLIKVSLKFNRKRDMEARRRFLNA